MGKGQAVDPMSKKGTHQEKSKCSRGDAFIVLWEYKTNNYERKRVNFPFRLVRSTTLIGKSFEFLGKSKN